MPTHRFRTGAIAALFLVLGLATGWARDPSAAGVVRYQPFSLKARSSIAAGDLALTMQEDGNLVLYRNGTGDPVPLWSSGTSGRRCGACSADFQGDGNLVLYDGKLAFWASNTSGQAGLQLALSESAPYVSLRRGLEVVWTGPERLTWFAPNFGGSRDASGRPKGASDYFELFASTSAWPQSSSRIQVFKMYFQMFHPGSATDDQLRHIFNFLKQHDIALAIEFGPLPKGWANCAQGEGEGYDGNEAQTIAKRISDLGGDLAYVAMDEPLFGGRYGKCRSPIPELAKGVARTFRVFQTYFPNVQLGDIEYLDDVETGRLASEFQQWTDALQSEIGKKLAFVHLDVHFKTGKYVPLVRTLMPQLQAKGIPLGIIFIGDETAGTDAQWVASAIDNVRAYRASGAPAPDQVIFQSWHPRPTHMLPETSPSAMTFLMSWFYEPNAAPR